GTPITRSQLPAFNVLRKKPRRCAHQVYSTFSPNSFANKSASLFSKPSSRSFEKGRLFGSAQTRNTPLGRLMVDAKATLACGVCFTLQLSEHARPMEIIVALREGEDIKRPSLRGG